MKCIVLLLFSGIAYGQTATVNGVANQSIVPAMSAAMKSGCLAEGLFTEGSSTPLDATCGSTWTMSAGGQTPTWVSNPTGLSVNNSQSVKNSATWGSVQTLILVYKPDVGCLQNSTIGFGVIASTNNAALLQVAPSNGIPAFYNGSIATIGDVKSLGYTATQWTFGNPNLIYQNGIASPGYPVQGTTGLSAGTGIFIGDYGVAPGAAFGFCGQLYYAYLGSSVLTAAQTQSYVEAQMRLKGITLNNVSPQIAQIAARGDSLTQGFGTTPNNYLPLQMYLSRAQSLLSMPVNITNLGVSGDSMNNMVTTDTTAIDNLKKQYDSAPIFIAHAFADTNDLANLARTPTQVHTDNKSWVAARIAAGERTVLMTTMSRAAVDANVTTLNGCTRDAFILAVGGTNVTPGCGGGALNGTAPGGATIPIHAVAWNGFDPNMGIAGKSTSSWFADGVHGNNTGYALIGHYVADAWQRALGGGEVCHRVPFSTNSNTNWTLNFGGGAGPAAANAGIATQAVPIYYIAPKQKLTRLSLKTTTAFSGTSLTALTVTWGDSVGGTTWYSSTTYDLVPAVSNTNYQDIVPPLNTSDTWGGSTLNLAMTATGANLNVANIAGAVDLTFCIASIP